MYQHFKFHLNNCINISNIDLLEKKFFIINPRVTPNSTSLSCIDLGTKIPTTWKNKTLMQTPIETSFTNKIVLKQEQKYNIEMFQPSICGNKSPMLYFWCYFKKGFVLVRSQHSL